MNKILSKQEWISRIATSGLILVGATGFFISLFDQLASYIPLLVFLRIPYDVSPLLLFVVSILTLSIGLERFAIFEEDRKIAKKRHSDIMDAVKSIEDIFYSEISELHQGIRGSSVVKTLIGNSSIYNETIRIVKKCQGSEIIRATSLGESNSDIESAYHYQHSPHTKFLEVLAQKIGQEKRKNLGMVYRVVVDQNKGTGIQARQEVFKQHEALDRLEIRGIDASWSLDFVIIGDKALLIGFPTIAKDREIRLAIEINDEDLVVNIIRWYDEYLWREAQEIV